MLQLSITSRALGVDAFGKLLISLAFGTLLGMAIDYGFYLSAQRRAINLKKNCDELGKLLTDVNLAKLFLALLLTSIFGFVAWLIKFHQYDIKLLLSVLLFSVGIGSSLTWFFRGSGRPVSGSIYEILSKIGAFSLIFLVVQDSDDVWKYFVAISTCQLVVFAIALCDLRRTYFMPAPNIRSSLKLLRENATFFTVHAAGTFFTGVNSLLLGLISVPTAVSVFGGAEKISRTAAVVLEPFRVAFFPEAHKWLEEGFNKAFKRMALMSCAMVCFASILSLIIFVLSEPIVIALFGIEFLDVIGALKILSVLPVILTINHSLSFLWILPRKLELQSLRILLFAIVLTLILAAWLVPTYGALGMASIVIFSEAIVALLLLIVCFVDFKRLKAKTILMR